MKIEHKIKTFNWRWYLLIGITGIIVFGVTAYNHHKVIHMTTVYAPLIDAAMEIKLEATTAHLWFEEILSGDRNEDMEAVWKHLDQADWYARAMLEGGKNSEGTFIPLDDDEMRQNILSTRKKLSEFKNITGKRFAAVETSGAGTDIDQHYDAIFNSFIAKADETETRLQQVMSQDLRRFRLIHTSLIGIGTLLVFVIGIAFYRFERLRNIDAIAIHHSNEKLRNEITERKQSERRLKAQHEVTKVLAESSTVKEAFPCILKAICEALNWDVGEIWEYDQQRNVLHNTEIWHAPSLKALEFEATAREITFLPEIGLPGRVWENAKPLWIEDVVYDTKFLRASIADKEGLHGAFGFPIIIGTEVLGTICFFSHEIRKPDKDLLDMMASIGRQIGLFIKRKQADLKLLKLSHAIEQSSSTVVITNVEGNIEYANPKFAELTGYCVEEAIGSNPRILKSGKTPTEVYKELWNTITSGNEWKGEFCNKKKNGEFYWESVSISPVKNNEGVIASFIGSLGF